MKTFKQIITEVTQPTPPKDGSKEHMQHLLHKITHHTNAASKSADWGRPVGGLFSDEHEAKAHEYQDKFDHHFHEMVKKSAVGKKYSENFDSLPPSHQRYTPSMGADIAHDFKEGQEMSPKKATEYLHKDGKHYNHLPKSVNQD